MVRMGYGRRFAMKCSEILLDRLDRSSVNRRTAEKRQAPRQPYRETVRVEMSQPEGLTFLGASLTRNISETGISFLIGRFLYPGSACRVHLPVHEGDPLVIAGTVRHCRYLVDSGYLHEVGVAFEHPIDLVLLKRTIELARTRLLVASEQPETHQLVAEAVSGLNVEVLSVHSAGEAVEQALATQPDLVLLDLDLADNEGLSAIVQLRRNAFVQPVIALTSSPEPPADDKEEMPFTSFLTKPLTRENLLREIGAYVYPRLVSEAAHDPARAPARS